MVDWANERRLATRWRTLVDACLVALPGIAAEFDEEDTVKSPGTVWTEIVMTALDEHAAPVQMDQADFWQQVMRLVELVEEAMVMIPDDSAYEEDLRELYAFSTAGIICDVTRNVRGLEELLPLMGPLSVVACRDEVDVHQQSRGFDGDAIDWTFASTRFQRHNIDPATIIPWVS